MILTVAHRTRRFRAASSLVCGVLAIVGEPSQSQTRTIVPPKFEVASIKLCKDELPPGVIGAGGSSSPERLSINCRTLKSLIQQAYDVYASGKSDPVSPMIPRLPIEGGPAWIDSDRYSIDAKADGTQSPAMMRGPMTQALLEDRFQLKIRRETREVPVYALTVSRGGLKLPRTKEGSCTPLELATPASPAPGDKPLCAVSRSSRRGPNVTWEARRLSIAAFAKALGLDRPIIDRTGIAGLFDFHLEFAPEADSGGPGDADRGPSIFTALQEQLGLKLEPAKGPAEFLVIDRVQRPSGN